MNRPSKITMHFLRKKTATLLLLSVSFGAFAMLGDGGRQKKCKLTETPALLPYSAKNFSLRSNYNYKSNNFLSEPESKEFIVLNPTVTYQKGNAAYILPLKKMPLLGKIKFTSTPQSY